jgi:hypothetical protein
MQKRTRGDAQQPEELGSIELNRETVESLTEDEAEQALGGFGLATVQTCLAEVPGIRTVPNQNTQPTYCNRSHDRCGGTGTLR